MRYMLVPASQVKEATLILRGLNPQASNLRVSVISVEDPNCPAEDAVEKLRIAVAVLAVSLRPRYLKALRKEGIVVESMATFQGARTVIQGWIEASRPSGRASVSPSEVFNAASTSCPNLIICRGALEVVDDVARHRHDFIHASVQALVEMATAGQPTGGLHAFFKARGMERKLATTGGSIYEMAVVKDGRVQEELGELLQVHLKEGDKTSPEAAVRLYFGTFICDGIFYVAIFYCGPHREERRKVDVMVP